MLKNDLVVKNNLCMLTLSYTGQGLYGYYNENDPRDIPLLEVHVYRKNIDGAIWETGDIVSACTNISAFISPEEATDKAYEMLDIIGKYWEEHGIQYAVDRAIDSV